MTNLELENPYDRQCEPSAKRLIVLMFAEILLTIKLQRLQRVAVANSAFVDESCLTAFGRQTNLLPLLY